MALFTGSENNSLYMYYKGLPKQLMTYKFDTVRSVLVSVSSIQKTLIISQGAILMWSWWACKNKFKKYIKFREQYNKHNTTNKRV